MSRRNTGFSPETKELVWQRARGLCERCGYGSSDVQHHHRRPRGIGGTQRPETNEPANCALLCASCHRIVESHRAQAFDDGWLVHQHHTPSEVPVYRRGRWVLLDNAGAYYSIPTPAGKAG